MTTSAKVREAWEENIWEHADIQAITPNIFMYDVLIDNQFQAEALHHEAKINFFTCQVRRAYEPLIMGQSRYTFQVIVQYYLQQTDQAESTFNTVIDRLETMDELVLTELGQRWDGTVDLYTGASPQDVVAITIDDKQCWRGGFIYLATKQT